MNRVRGEWALGTANGIALLASAAAAAGYARWLDADRFAHWTAALAAARLALLLLDGGFKTALVRRERWPDERALRLLQRLTTSAALLLSALAAGVAAGFGGDAWLYAVYVGAYALAHAASFRAAARLERAGSFHRIARAEGACTVLEFTMPALLLAAGAAPLAAFAVAVVGARALRAAWVTTAAPSRGEEAGATVDGLRPLLKEGLGVQAVAGLSMLRDHLHLWLLAPWFGAAWAGQFGFAALACALATQAVVQAASRASLPALRAKAPARRWVAVRARVQRLALIVLPPLPLLPALLAWADERLWQGQWAPAVALLPWLAVRMVAGVAATPVGSWLMVSRTPWAAARAHAVWTAIEVVFALAALALFGPQGLAIAAALAAWPGLALLLQAAEPRARWGLRLRRLLPLLVCRRPVVAGLVLGVAVQVEPALLPWALLALPLAWMAHARRRWRPLVPVHRRHA